MKSLYLLVSFLMGLECAAIATVFETMLPRRVASVTSFLRKPLWFGGTLGAICLIWSAVLGAPMLEGDLERFRLIVYAIVPVAAVACYFFLDFLNIRALSGWTILCVTAMIQGAFTHDVPMRWLYGSACVLLGVCGMIGLGSPWHLRNAITRLSDKTVPRHCLSTLLYILAALFAFLPLCARL